MVYMFYVRMFTLLGTCSNVLSHMSILNLNLAGPSYWEVLHCNNRKRSGIAVLV
jgi:hypothetical protein